MSTPINLNQARKARAKAQKRASAAVNATKFGRSKAQKTQDDQAAKKLRAHLDHHKVDP